MILDAPKNNNYAVTVVRVPATYDLDGLDNLVGVKVFNSQILTQRDGVEPGELRLYFPAEVQISDAYASINNLYSDSALNADPEAKGYLAKNRRVRAIKLRGHRSDALLMPLDSLRTYTADWANLVEGDTFDTIEGREIVRKFELPRNEQKDGATKLAKVLKRVDKALFPEHLSTDNYWRNSHLLDERREVVLTQKLHGTSIRVGRVPVRREKGRWERFLNRLGAASPDFAHEPVFGSRKVIKEADNSRQNHYYGSDIWTRKGAEIVADIPDGFIVYGELIGWTEDGSPLQKGYTYNVPAGKSELYVYRVARIDVNRTLTDLPWDGVKQFCKERGWKYVPEIYRIIPEDEVDYAGVDLDHHVTTLMDVRYADEFGNLQGVTDKMVPLSDAKTVDEGVCLRQDAITPVILKAKAPKFLQHETKQLDKGEVDLESAA
ncbi:RNA ligase [Gordonia phage Syleon]|uniref:RNA ligase n=1 Tax=Gordonia phage Syleon TaxID=2653718 RepID=A0A5Q2WEL9_9CAUD|nr:RNA ligase [Gordonia phage Syleon]QGH75820.1 RNA ligase [Gordonia phage Syleon]